ncbi:ATP-binding protein [Enterobacter ludwigii]|uniref:ATP-binding protein n=1 Tax=Enterobacter ludwigii TaxID=299767 RepID=UPI003F6F5D14
MAVRAIYHQTALPEYRGNPLIEALPPLMSEEDVMSALSNFPEICATERELSHSVREQYIDRIDAFRCPQGSFFECYKAIARLLRTGYVNRNPLDAHTVRFLHYSEEGSLGKALGDGFHRPKAGTFSVTGISGVGKSTMLEQVLGHFPQVIDHINYYGHDLTPLRQVVWLKVNCPPNSKARDLTETLLNMIDDALGMERTPPPSRAGTLLRLIAQKMKSAFIGVLVIDEMQRLTRTNGDEQLINFLHEIVDILGVPLVFCGNPEFEDKMRQRLRFARRAETTGFMRLNPLAYQSSDWQSFVYHLWRYQWTNVYTPLSDELNIKLHKLSKGILAIAQRVFMTAQLKVIGTGNEVITPALLSLSESVLTSRSDEFIVTDALIFTEEASEETGAEINSIEAGQNNSSPDRPARKRGPDKSVHKSVSIVGDLKRPQHAEFAEELNNFTSQTEAVLAGRCEPVLFRALWQNNCRYSALKHYCRLCEDPSTET